MPHYVRIKTSELEALRANLAATEEAYTDAVDRLEETRALCREQITKWKRDRPWSQIEKEPCTKAFYGPLGGT